MGVLVRRLIVEPPTSEASIWSVRFALFAISATAVAIALARLGQLAPGSALTVFGAALVLALLAMLLAGTAAAAIWRTGRRGAGRAAFGFLLASALMAYPAYLTCQAIVLPKIADVTTDFAEPPSFLISYAARKARGDYAPPPYDRAEEAAQRAAYPDIAPLFVDLEAPQAYQLARRVAEDAGWKVLDSTPPNLRGNGVAHIDAVDRSLFFGVVTDIAVRVTPLANQTRIDLRAVTRVGKHDFGANARRIRKFLAMARDFQQEK